MIVSLILMDISWYGQSCFKLKGKSATVIINSTDLLEADIVLNSHKLPGHQTSVALSSPMVFDSPGEYEVKGVAITGISSESTNIIYHLFLDKLNIVHLGDLGEDKLTEEQLEEIGQTDILLMPKSAAEIVAQLEPKIIIPMCEAPEQFLKEIGVAGVEAQPKLSISKEKLPEEPIVVVLKQS